jgi:hypothetical protein
MTRRIGETIPRMHRRQPLDGFDDATLNNVFGGLRDDTNIPFFA